MSWSEFWGLGDLSRFWGFRVPLTVCFMIELARVGADGW